MKKNEKRRKSNLLNRIMAVAASLVMMFTLLASAVPAQAANVAPTENLTTTFNKYLVMDKDANVPNAEFTFSIAPGAAVAASGEDPAIYAGNDANRVEGSPTIDNTGKAEFQVGDTTYDTVQSPDTVSLTADQKYAKETVTVNFEQVKFKAPGIYRYVITEESTSIDGISNDTISTRTLDVVIEYATGSETELIVKDYVLYQGTKTDALDESEKDDGFTNTYATNNLTLKKVVTGNQGDRDKYFKFTVELSNATPGTKYTVNLSNADASPTVDGEKKTNPATLEVGSDGTVTAMYYLNHNQYIVIQGLTAGTNYKFTEEVYTADGYKTTYVIDDGSVQVNENNTTGQQTMGNAGHTVTFTNDKEGTVPTGILMETAPFILLGAVMIAGIVVLFLTRRRRVR